LFFVALVYCQRSVAGWSSPVARQAHNLKAAGSNPAPATKLSPSDQGISPALTGFFICDDRFPTFLNDLL
jgi:hypothetical protein